MQHHPTPRTPDPGGPQAGGFWRSRYAVGLLVSGLVAGYFLWTEHRAHLAQWWPYAIVLLCPLMHVFMHGGHGHQHGHGGAEDTQTSRRDDTPPRS